MRLMIRLVPVVALAVGLTGPGPVSAAQGAVGAVYDPSTLCRSATPTADELAATFGVLATTTVAHEGAGYEQRQAATLISATGESSTSTGSYVYDAAAQRAQMDSTGQYSGKTAVFGLVADRATSTVYELHAPDGTDPVADAQTRAGLTTLRRSSVWVRSHQTMTVSTLVGGFNHDWTDITDDLDEFRYFNTAPTFTCTVSGSTATLAATGTDGTSRAVITVDAAGNLIGLTETLHAPQEILTVIDTASFGPPSPVKLPGDSITDGVWRAAVVRGMLPILRNAIVKSAKATVKTLPNLNQRTAAVRALAKTKAAAFMAVYGDNGEVSVARTNVTAGVKVTVVYQGLTKGYFTMHVKGKTIVVATHLP
jgi:hypothetical protein